MTWGLDVKELQVLIHFPQDAGGYFWHHRLCLHRCSPGAWVAATPDGDYEVLDLKDHEYKFVSRSA